MMLIKISMDLIVKWNLKINLELTCSKRKASAVNQSISKDNYRKYSFKLIKLIISKNAQLNYSIIMHLI